ncbi:MAG: riboflavin synthase [Candidatus Omnitrophota bacterium]|nr:riboflavin synthase [Candidatus Omnitrophota bacterium]
MFTGIISETGKVKSIKKKGSLACLEIECSAKFAEGILLGDSVAVNGVCLSVTKKNRNLFFDVMDNTFKTTNLKRLKTFSYINLENALKFGEDLSGHIVSGHVDCESVIKKIQKIPGRYIIDIGLLPQDKKYIVTRGSVTLDGISLTVAEVYGTFFRVHLIPHTIENTTLTLRKKGDFINVEFDVLAKYVEKNSKNVITTDLLQKKGFM